MNYFKDPNSLLTIFKNIKGEHHTWSRRAAELYQELNIMANPKYLKKLYEYKNNGLVRQWSKPPQRTDKSMVILHWNILADALAFADLVKDGFACGNDVLSWEKSRKDKIITEILRWDPDVFGLVE